MILIYAQLTLCMDYSGNEDNKVISTTLDGGTPTDKRSQSNQFKSLVFYSKKKKNL